MKYPNEPQFYLQRSICSYNLKRYEDAIDDAYFALMLDPDLFLAYYYISLSSYFIGIPSLCLWSYFKYIGYTEEKNILKLQTISSQLIQVEIKNTPYFFHHFYIYSREHYLIYSIVGTINNDIIKKIFLINHLHLKSLPRIQIHPNQTTIEFFYKVPKDAKYLEEVLPKLEEYNKQSIINTLLQTFHKLHENNIIRGITDISSIMIDSELKPILTSFNFSQILNVKPELQAFVSENIRQMKTPTIKDDLYSLGSIFFYIYTGKIPDLKLNPDQFPEQHQDFISQLLSAENLSEICKENRKTSKGKIKFKPVKICTYNQIGPTKVPQHIFYCKDCRKYICNRCRKVCHYHHKISEYGYTDEYICQCHLCCKVWK